MNRTNKHRRSGGVKRLAIEAVEQRSMLSATYLDATGVTDLRAELGSAAPTGAGVSVSQIEHKEQSIGGYAPDKTDPNFAGKTLTIESGPSLVSQHATRVGEHLYGLSAGVAPGIKQVQNWELGDWTSRFLKVGTTLPPAVEKQRIENHSWDGGAGSTSTDLESLRRFDYLIARDNVFAAVAIGNQGTQHVPHLLASNYNAITVGLSNGTANFGLTAFDGAGRVKPDIVAPEGKSSQATPQVSGAAALLIDQAAHTTWTAAQKADAGDSIALKAMLMAGTTKSELPSWNRTPQQPLDLHFGSGQLNVVGSNRILLGGEQAPGTITSAGWDVAQTAAPGGSRVYSFTVPADVTLGEASVALTWNRTITSTLANGFGNLTSTLANLDLHLNQIVGGKAVPVDSSVSTVDNVEYLYLKNLGPGSYQLVVTADTPQVQYAMAWNYLSQSTTTTLTSSDRLATPGQPVTFSATVVSVPGAPGTSAGTPAAPTGTVTFFDNGKAFDTVLLAAAGGTTAQASTTTVALGKGLHTITAIYSGQGDFVASTSNKIREAVGQVLGTNTTLASSNPKAVAGSPVTLTINVSSSQAGFGTPAGSVTLFDNGVALGTLPLVNGKVSMTLTTLSVGNHTLTAVYAGNANFLSSTSTPFTEKITPKKTSASAADSTAISQNLYQASAQQRGSAQIG